MFPPTLPPMMRDEPERIGRYRKDPKDEAFLRKLNALLAPHQEADYTELPERHPTLHIIGVPRSGTTLLYQLIATCLDVGYITNLAAAFWRAPVYGIRLSRKLIPEPRPSSFQSSFGQTSGLHEPHEFGYFWSDLLGYRDLQQPDPAFDDQIDWAQCRHVLTNLTDAFGKPVCFKWLLIGWHLNRLQEALPKTCVVRIRRDPVESALSLLRFREQTRGSVNDWVSLRPREYAWLQHEPYWIQVAGQVYFLERAMTEQLTRLNPHQTLEVTYADLCSDPRAVLEAVRALLHRAAGPETGPTRSDLVLEPPVRFPSGTRDWTADPDYLRVQAAVRQFFTS